MIETKLKNAAEKLPQTKSTYYDVMKKAETNRNPGRIGKRAAVFAVAMILVCGVVFAGVTEADYSAWAAYSSEYTDAVKVANEVGITIPEQLCDSPFYNIATMCVVPDGTSYLEALTIPVYRWHSAAFGTETIEYDDNGKGCSPAVVNRITLSFGSTENELWKYVFGADDDGSWNTDDNYNNVTTFELEETTLQLSEKKLYSPDGDELSVIDYTVRWVDFSNNAVFVLHMSGSPDDGADAAVEIAREIISAN